MSAWAGAATALADALEAENAALAALDMAAATGLLERKRSALAALEAVELSGAGASARAAAERLVGEAARNKQLLERAIAVQDQVIARLLRAVPLATPAARYGARGRQVHRAAPIAMRARV